MSAFPVGAVSNGRVDGYVDHKMVPRMKARAMDFASSAKKRCFAALVSIKNECYFHVNPGP